MEGNRFRLLSREEILNGAAGNGKTREQQLQSALLDVLVYAPNYMHGMPKKHYEKIARGEVE